MRREAITLVMFMFLSGAVTAHQSYEKMYDRHGDSVVAVRVSNETDTSTGSGFVYRERIVTSNHVVTSEEEVYPEVEVSRGDSEEWYGAEVVGRDERSDLAVLKPEGMQLDEGLPTAETSPEPGQRVVVFGNSYGMKSTITQGIVSGVNRTPVTEEGVTIEDAVQVDAPVNPGDSGGPLMTENGTVLGVVNARIGDNIGFATHYRDLEQFFQSIE